MMKCSKFTHNIGSGNFSDTFCQNINKFQQGEGGDVTSPTPLARHALASIYHIGIPARTLWKNKQWASVKKADPIFCKQIVQTLNLKRKLWNKGKLIQPCHQQFFSLKEEGEKEVSIKISSWYWSRQISKFYHISGAHIHLRQTNI